jgi:hypothetical protein
MAESIEGVDVTAVLISFEITGGEEALLEEH